MLIEKASDSLIASKHMSAKGFGLCEQQADRSARRQLSRLASTFVAEQLARYTGKPERTINVNVLNSGNTSQFQRLRNTLQNMRWVSNLDVGSYDNRQSLLKVRYDEKTNYLAKRLARIPWIELIDYNWNTIDIRLIDEQQRSAYEF